MYGKFVVVEGIDNVGKTALCTEVVKHLQNAVYVRTPLEPFHIKCKEFKGSFEERYKLFVEGIEYSSEIIKKYNELGITIVADRWIWTTFAYHFAKDNDLFDKYKNTYPAVLEGLRGADASYLIVVSDTDEWIQRHKKKNLSEGDLQLLREVELRKKIERFFTELNPSFEVVDNSGEFGLSVNSIMASLAEKDIF